MRRALLWCVVSIGICAGPVAAFKIETHVWIAQQVLNDVLPDGRVSIPPFGEFDVRSEVVEALRSNASAYRMGHIGPDAFPDLLVGQSTFHPGKPVGADEWGQSLLDRSETVSARAIALGFLGHSAGDVFAHTYVNLYAGDAFDLADGQAEEVRHIALEDYIARATPPLHDLNGQPVGDPWNVVDVPTEFVRDALIYGSVDRHRQIPSAIHLVAMTDFRRVLSEALDRLAELEAAIRQFHLAPNLDLVSRALAEIDRLRGRLRDLESELQSLHDEAAKIPGRLTDVRNDLADLEAKAAGLLSDVLRMTCVDACDKQPVLRQECKDECNKALNAANRLIEEKKRLQQELNAREGEIATRVAQIPGEIDRTRSELDRKTEDVIFKKAQELVDTINAFLNNINPVKAILTLWITDADKAAAEYVNSGRTTAQELMKPSGSPLKPYGEWVKCWGPVYQGIPSVISTTPCAIHNLIDEAKQKFEDFRKSLGSAIWLIDPVGEAKREATKLALEKVEEAARNAIRDLLVQVGRKDIADFIELVDQGADAGRLNEIFRQDASGKGLLRFDRVSRRIDADMAAQDGRFNSDCTIGSKCFHAAYNAVVLAKLTLLDGPTLNALVSQVLGKPYDRYSGGPGAILRRGVRNIDGNHQWQQKAPPFFRVDGSHPPEGQFREFGYPLTPEGGFQLWSPDDDVRNRVFLRIFRGPVAPALENPCASEFPDVVHPSYKYRTCSAKPFADSTAPTGVACQSARITDLTFLHDETGFEWTKVQVRVENSGPRASRKRLRTDILSADSPTATKGGVIAFVEDMRLPQICDGESRDVVMWLDLPPLDPGRYHVVTTITDGKNVDSVQRATRTIDVAPCKQRYKIKEDETLHAIAKQFEMGVWKIAGRNRIYDLNAIQAGQTICIP